MNYKLLLWASVLWVPLVIAEDTRKIKHEAVWQELLDELKKLECCELELPKTPSDAAALQAQSLAKMLHTVEELKSRFSISWGENEQYKRVLELLKDIECEIKKLSAVVGALDDESVPDLPSVQAIDQAQLTAIQWLKSIYRFLLEHHCVS